MHALKIDTYVLNRVLSKAIPKISFKLFDNLEKLQIIYQTPPNGIIANEHVMNEPHEILLRRSQRQKRLLFLMIMWLTYKSHNLT